MVLRALEYGLGFWNLLQDRTHSHFSRVWVAGLISIVECRLQVHPRGCGCGCIQRLGTKWLSDDVGADNRETSNSDPRRFDQALYPVRGEEGGLPFFRSRTLGAKNPCVQASSVGGGDGD